MSATTATTARNPPSAPRIFEEALREFKNRLSLKELAYFESVDLKDVEDTVKKIQLEQKRKKQMQNLTRIKPFLDAMEQYGKIIGIFVNASVLVAYVWGPIKFLLTVASTCVDAFDCLLSAYEELGECLPLYSQYEEHFRTSSHMYQVLGYVYKDILTFHLEVYKTMKGSMWRAIFSVTWPAFKAALTTIRTNLLRHKNLVENQASLLHFQEFRNAREVAERQFRESEIAERQRQHQEILQWLAMPTDSTPATDQERFANVRQDYSASGQWLYKCSAYQKWRDPLVTDIPVVWLHGIPGAGKTILASFIIEKALQSPAFTVGWFYCKFANPDKNTYLVVVRGVLAQLVQGNDSLRPYILQARNSTNSIKLVSQNVAKQLMEQCLQALDKTCLIIDGLDECNQQERRDIISLFTGLAKKLNDDVPGSIRVLFVSTDESDIRKPLSKFVHIHLKAADNHDEMKQYARGWSAKIQELHALTDEETEKIALDVLKRADGMYLFCYLVFNNLFGQLTREDLDRELDPDSLPIGLGDAYEKFLHRIDTHPQQPYRLYARKILGWVACAKRSLKWHEIQGALCMGKYGDIDMERRRLTTGVKELCGALVEVQSSGTVEFVHLSAREPRLVLAEFSPKEPWIDIVAVQLNAALVCVQYLTLDCFKTDLTDDQVSAFVRKGYYCFQDYAVVHWYHHVEACLNGLSEAQLETLPASLNAFLECNWDASTELPKTSRKVPAKAARRLQPLKDAEFPEVFRNLTHFLCALETLPEHSPPPFLNFRRQVQRARAILEVQQQEPRGSKNTLNFQEYYGACFNTFKCSRESCIHFVEGFTSSPDREKHEAQHDRPFRCTETTCPSAQLGFASQNQLRSHIASAHPIGLFLGQDNDQISFNSAHNVVDDGVVDEEAFIVEVAEAGCLDTVQALVQRGANANAQDLEGMTALHRASARGHIEIVHLLLQVPDISLSLQNNDGSTPLHVASRSGHIQVVELLLLGAADPKAKDYNGRTALHAAVHTGNIDLVRTLITYGTPVATSDKDGQCALSLASHLGYIDMVKSFVPHLLSLPDDKYTPLDIRHLLITAARIGHLHIVELMLDKPLLPFVDKHRRDDCLYAAVEAATMTGHLNLAHNLLADRLQDPTLVPRVRQTALQAARNGQVNVVKFFLDLFEVTDHYPDHRNDVLAELLHAAVHNLQADTVSLTLKFGARLNAAAFSEDTIRCAVEIRHPKILQLVLQFYRDKVGSFLTAFESDHAEDLISPSNSSPTLRPEFRIFTSDVYTQVLRRHVQLIKHKFSPRLAEALVSAGALVPLSLDDEPCRTWLHKAAEDGELDIVRLLTGANSEIGVIVPTCTPDINGVTALDIAAVGLEVDILRYLMVDCGARLSTHGQQHILFYILRIQHRLSEAHLRILTHKLDPIQRSHIPRLNETIQLLLHYHPDLLQSHGPFNNVLGFSKFWVTTQAHYILTELDDSNSTPCDGDPWFSLLMERCNKAELQINGGTTMLLSLVSSGRKEYVCSLLDKREFDLDIDAPVMLFSSTGIIFCVTALQLACTKGHTGIVKSLLQHGAYPTLPLYTQDQPPPLYIAACNGHVGITHLLLQNWVDPNFSISSSYGKTVLHCLAGLTTDKSGTLLGMPIFSDDNTNPLPESSSYDDAHGLDKVDHALVWRLLLHYGANPMLKDDDGNTAFDILHGLKTSNSVFPREFTKETAEFPILSIR